MLGQVQAWSSKVEDYIEAYTQVSWSGWAISRGVKAVWILAGGCWKWEGVPMNPRCDGSASWVGMEWRHDILIGHGRQR